MIDDDVGKILLFIALMELICHDDGDQCLLMVSNAVFYYIQRLLEKVTSLHLYSKRALSHRLLVTYHKPE